VRHLRDVILRRRPLPSSAEPYDAGEPEQVSEPFDLDALRAKLQEPEGAREQLLEKPAHPAPEETAGPAGGAADPAPKKQIWDIEDGDRDGDAIRPPQKPARRAPAGEPASDPPVARIRTGLDRDTAAAPASTATDRVKTRLIGFHAGGADNDVFAAERAAPSAKGQFPAGWLVVVDGPGRGASFTISAGVSTIGRGTDQTICLDFGDTSVSRENHASIAYDEEQNRFFVGHGGKSNIVRRNGNAVLSTEELADADLIRIGKTTLRFVALCGPDFSWGPAEDRQESDAPES
jgi:hypothetical protein